ncbi:MAG: hypothetical protein RLY61_67 [Candidatus Parcubacteria bacterium]
MWEYCNILMIKSLLYFEPNTTNAKHVSEDAYASSANVFAVADGITHDLDEHGNYPVPSDSGRVASIVCKSLVDELSKSKLSLTAMQDAFISANLKVRAFNAKSNRYKKRETNGYDIGAATVAVIAITGNTLLYGVLDDCYISVFGSDYIDHPILRSYVDSSAHFLDHIYDWSDLQTRKLWRKELRNNQYVVNGTSYGYGALDGREGFLPYLQLGEVELRSGDLVCVYTDGFIKLIQQKDFIQVLREKLFTESTYDFIQQSAQTLHLHKEKTGYFIQV